jgi:murein DD-endopeptidase MepM/ murein hydrolase activator NlpD
LVKDYTKANLGFRLLALAAMLAVAFLPGIRSEAGMSTGVSTRESTPEHDQAVQSATSFAGWHWPVPAGTWLVSRGPCGSKAPFSHQCGYFEDSCAYDLTPLSDSMLSVPVLAPQAGQVFFLGTRDDSGTVVMLRHDDGRVSALMHLSKVVVGLDQRVALGQVVGYAGNTGSSTRPHLHFDVQPNAVERTCLPLAGLDEIDTVKNTVRSHNLAWTALVLTNPPEHLPAWLAVSNAGAASPAPRIVFTPTALSRLPVALDDSRLGGQTLFFQGQLLTPTLKLRGQTVFEVPLTGAAVSGEYTATLQLRSAPKAADTTALTVTYSVRPAVDTHAALGIIVVNPTFVSPVNWASLTQTPKLCWSEYASAGVAPLSFRVMVAGPVAADSGWQAATCWMPPALPRGTYFWKVFVRDARGYMNRTNQRPVAFKIY